MNEAQTLVGVIDEVKSEDAKPDSGKDWRRYDFRIRSPEGMRRYSTFDKGWPTNLKTGHTYRFTFTTREYAGRNGPATSYDLINATEVDPSEFGAQPTSNGAAYDPTITPEFNAALQARHEPPTDEAKERVTTGEPQPEFKSPSRSYDQNRDIERRSIERQVALKAAVEILKDRETDPTLDSQVYLRWADDLFAWLREARDLAPESPADSDGGPPLFPPEGGSDTSSAPRITTMVGLLRVLKKDFRLGKEDLPKIDTILKRAGMKPLARSTNLQAVYNEISRGVDEAEAAYRKQQAEPIASGTSKDMESEAGRSPTEKSESQ